jgi:hypothetical protein
MKSFATYSGYNKGDSDYGKNKYQKGSGYQKKEGGSEGSTGTERLMYNNKRIYLRGYNVTKDKVMLAI